MRLKVVIQEIMRLQTRRYTGFVFVGEFSRVAGNEAAMKVW